MSESITKFAGRKRKICDVKYAENLRRKPKVWQIFTGQQLNFIYTENKQATTGTRTPSLQMFKGDHVTSRPSVNKLATC